VKTSGAFQTVFWMALGVGTFVFLNTRRPTLDLDAARETQQLQPARPARSPFTRSPFTGPTGSLPTSPNSTGAQSPTNPVVASGGVKAFFRLDTLPKPFAALRAPRLLPPRFITKAKTERLRALDGTPVQVTVTAYCLTGTTRLGHPVREGIVAADPRVFPLGSELELTIGRRPAGRFRVEDTGLLIKGQTIDIWVPDCSQAIEFGRKKGIATLRSKIRR
jgi:3D (Asp-Asp-Asp) domain-containing protein